MDSGKEAGNYYMIVGISWGCNDMGNGTEHGGNYLPKP